MPLLSPLVFFLCFALVSLCLLSFSFSMLFVLLTPYILFYPFRSSFLDWGLSSAVEQLTPDQPVSGSIPLALTFFCFVPLSSHLSPMRSFSFVPYFSSLTFILFFPCFFFLLFLPWYFLVFLYISFFSYVFFSLGLSFVRLCLPLCIFQYESSHSSVGRAWC